MLKLLVCRTGLLTVLGVCAACSSPTAPPLPSPPPVVVATNPVPSPSSPFPGPGVYVFMDTPGVRVQDYTAGSRFVLNPDGTFAIQFPASEYRGRYAESEGRLSFTWNDWSQGSATAVFSGDTMIVAYNTYLSLTDFENARYVRVP